MDIPKLDSALFLARRAAQELWDARQKEPATPEVSAFLEPAQVQLELLLEILEFSRDSLKSRAT